MKELIRTLIVLSFLFAVLYAVFGVLGKRDYNAYLIVAPVLLGVILLLALNFLFPEKTNTWIRKRKDEDV